MRHRSSKATDKTEIDEDVHADLEWLKREEHAVRSGVPAGNSNLTSAPGRVSSSLASKRSSSVTELQKLLRVKTSNTNCGARRCQSGSSRTTLQYSAQQNPLFLHDGTSPRTRYSSIAGQPDSRYSSSPGRHASVAAAASLSDPSSLQGLRTHLESISQQLNRSKDVVTELCSENGVLQQRLSQRNAETQSAVAALLQHNGQLQHQVQRVLVPAQQQLTAVSAAAGVTDSTEGIPATADEGASTTSLTFNERKLVKFLKRLQKDRDRLNEQVQQLLQTQTQLLQQVHENTTKAVASQTSPQRQQATSPLRSQQQVQHLQCNASPVAGLTRSWMTSTSTCDDENELHMQLQQLQQLQQQLDAMSTDQQGQAAAAGSSAVSAALSDSIGMSKDWLTSRQSATGLQQQQQQGTLSQQCQRQEVIEDQATTIVELKKVIAELEQQTTMLRSQSRKQDSSVQALADCQAALSAKQAQIEDLQRQHNEQHELSQAALRDAIRATNAAEAERDNLQQRLLDESKSRQEAQEAKETLVAELERLRSERQQLLLRLLQANEQITDLHEELGPAVLTGSPTRRGSSGARASRALQPAETGWSSGSPNGHSGIGQQLSIAVGELSEKTQAMLAAREAAAKTVKDMRAEYNQLQQQYGELQARHELLQEEHAQLLNRQLGVASERGSFRQQYLATEEQYLAAKQQIFELQNELVLLKANQAASATRPAPAIPAGASDQALQQPLMLTLAADNAHLAVALAEIMQEQDSLREQLDRQQQQQQPGGYMLSPAAAAAAIEVQQQRLHLLVSQLVMVRDRAADAANVAQLQQEKMQLQQQQLVQLTADLALLQQQYAKPQREHLQQAQAAVLAAVKAAAGPGSVAVAQATEETFKLRLELVNQAEKMRQLAAENEALQAAAIDRVRVEQLDAKNKVLLQEVTHLLTDVSKLREKLWVAQWATWPHAAATAHPLRAASPQPQEQQQQQQQHATMSPPSCVTSSPASSRHTSRQPSLSQIGGDASGITRSPTLSQVTSPSLSQATSLRDQLASDTIGLGDVTSSVTASPFSTAAASAARAPGASGSTTPSALRSRSFTEGSKPQVSWTEKLGNEVMATAAAPAGSTGSQRSSPLGSPKRMSFNQLEQQPGSYGSALDSVLTAAQATSPTSAPVGPADDDESHLQGDGIGSRTWSGLQPTPRSSAPSPAAVGATAEQPGMMDASAAPASPSSNRASLIAAVLDRQRSKGSLIASGDGSIPQQQQQQADRPPASSNSRSNSFPTLQAQSAGTAVSGNGSPAAAGLDRAALIAAVLQRQKSKQAGDNPGNAFAFAPSAGNSVNGAAADFSRGASASGAVSPQASAVSVQLQPPGGTTVGKDRASIVAAVLAQRQQKQQQQQGDDLEAVQTGSSGSSLNGSAGAAANRASVSSPTDRAALVAAVLAKHNIGK